MRNVKEEIVLDWKKWFEKNFISEIENETYNLVTAFPIIWMVFEKEKSNENFTVATALKNLDLNANNSNKINKLYYEIKEYCEAKYDSLHLIYMNFHFRNSDINFELFKQKYYSDKFADNLEVFLWFTYRVRNNMFHGIKCINELNSQKKLFQILNEFLIICIES